MTVAEEIAAAVNYLPVEKQLSVLMYAKQLAQVVPSPRSVLPPGPPATAFQSFTSTLPAHVVDEMAQAIEEGCERIDSDRDDASF